jgi:hypothetical protein
VLIIAYACEPKQAFKQVLNSDYGPLLTWDDLSSEWADKLCMMGHTALADFMSAGVGYTHNIDFRRRRGGLKSANCIEVEKQLFCALPFRQTNCNLHAYPSLPSLLPPNPRFTEEATYRRASNYPCPSS